jgi:PIN domain nuclease of toxin-antitoxin system
MNFLLDTHVWIWSITVPAQLNTTTQIALIQPQHRLFLSPMSVWETLLLIEKQRLPTNLAPEVWLDLALQALTVHEVPLTYGIARRSRQLALPHQDPVDRFLAATAVEYGFTLITADQHLLNSPEVTTWRAN